MTETPWRGRRIHLVGVGGAGMSAYARAAAALGAEVSGSDAVASAATEALASDCVLRAAIGHARENVPEGTDVEALLGDRERRGAMSLASRTLARPRAALDVANELLEIARG